MKGRRFSCAVAFTLVLLLAFAYWLVPYTKTSTAAPAPAGSSPFKRKTVWAVLASQHSIVLEHAEIRKLGDRYYLVGKGNNECLPGKWTNGQMEWVSLNQVEDIVEFESLEALKKAVEESEKKKPAAPG